MKHKYLILVPLFLFLGVKQALPEETVPPWESSRLWRDHYGGDYVLERVKEELKKAKAMGEDGNKSRAWESYLHIQRGGPEELIEQKAGHWETAAVVAWREMKELLRKKPDFFEGILAMTVEEGKIERLYENLINDGKLTPYESFKFFWYAAPHLPTRMAGYLYEKIGDSLLEQGDLLRAYATYQNILNYSTYRGIRKDFTERVEEKLKALGKRYGEILNKIKKVSALEGIRLSDGTRYRLVVENLETGELALFLEISFPEKVIRRKIYDVAIPLCILVSKKYGPHLIRDKDKVILMSQLGSEYIVFDLNGMLLEKKPLTQEIVSRYEIKSLHEILFTEDDFALIPKGTFQMGSPPNEGGIYRSETLHTVTLTKDFYLQRTEVTQLQWYLLMGEAPSSFKERQYCEEDWDEELQICPNHPVEQVSWDEAQAFNRKLNEMQSEYVYRLPTEAEWEYAARLSGVGDVERRKFLTPEGSLDIRESGWAKTVYGFGNSEDRLRQYAWYNKNAKNQTHSVLDSRIKPIGGLYNMHGNVREWVSDWYGEYPTGTVIDPKGPPTGSDRVIRGGGLDYYPQNLRSANRYLLSPVNRGRNLGFRVLRVRQESAR